MLTSCLTIPDSHLLAYLQNIGMQLLLFRQLDMEHNQLTRCFGDDVHFFLNSSSKYFHALAHRLYRFLKLFRHLYEHQFYPSILFIGVLSIGCLLQDGADSKPSSSVPNRCIVLGSSPIVNRISFIKNHTSLFASPKRLIPQLSHISHLLPICAIVQRRLAGECNQVGRFDARGRNEDRQGARAVAARN